MTCGVLPPGLIQDCYTNIRGNIINDTDDFNERTNTLLYKNITLTLYSRKSWCFLHVRGELETGTDCYKLTQSSSDHSSTSSSFWLSCSTVGHWGPKPSVWSWFSLRHLVPLLTPTATGTWTDSNCNCNSNSLKPSVAPGYIIVWHPPASCGHTHLHRIQPRPQVKVIFRYLRLDAPVLLLHRCISWLTARSGVNMLDRFPWGNLIIVFT